MSYSRQESYTLSVCMQTASLKFVSQFCPLMKINPFIIIGFFPVIEYDKTKKMLRYYLYKKSGSSTLETA